jgi:hypothetical protein
MNGKKLVLTKYVKPVQKDDKPAPTDKDLSETSKKKEIKCKTQSAEPAQSQTPKKIFKLKTSGKAA